MPTYDLTHALETGMPTYPGDPDVELTPHATHGEDGYRVTALSLGTHAGTHVDAPSHTELDGDDVGAFDVSAFEFDARLADVRGKAPREPIRRSDLPDATDGDLLVVRTGWDAHWGTESYLDHPYLTEAAAAWCAESGYSVAVDALSVDPTPTENATADEPQGVPAHHALLGSGRLILENLTGIADLPRRFSLRAYPLALESADGAPVRAVAVTDA